ncbi:MAG: hypothetical protein B7X57_04260 [Erythrobacter sp. 34-65-8]|nr:MAG: hypothetical protein B7X57_04260 [Erythrobacter sp. 34-65-8]
MMHSAPAPVENHPRAVFGPFAQTFLPSGTPDDIVSELMAIGHLVSAKRCARAFLDPAVDQMVYLSRGATKLVATASEGREQIVAFHFAGDLISVPASAQHAYSLHALVDSQLLTFPTRQFVDCAERSPAVLRQVLDRVLVALHRSRDKAVGLGRKNAEERLASFFVAMAQRIGRPEGKGLVLDLPMSRRDIADALGLTIETVSRQLGRLRELGLIETSGRSGVRLLQPSALEARAAHFQLTA